MTGEDVQPEAFDASSLLAAFVDATEALVVIVAADGAILFANPALQRFTGRSAAELLGRPFWAVYVVPEHVALAQDAVERAIATGQAHPQEGDWLTGDGVRRRVAMRNTVLTDGAGRPFAVGCVGVDVTADREREAGLHARAQTDLLTGIPNRAALFDALHRHAEADGAETIGVLFCDLDRFKAINDELGHAMGDRLLAEVAHRIAAVAGPRELVTRFGGDEFVILCPGADEAALTALAERVRAAVAPPVVLPTATLGVGVSVGTALGRAGEAPDDLIARADRDMYGAKSHHRRRAPRD